jgi:hypothetical protein
MKATAKAFWLVIVVIIGVLCLVLYSVCLIACVVTLVTGGISVYDRIAAVICLITYPLTYYCILSWTKYAYKKFRNIINKDI